MAETLINLLPEVIQTTYFHLNPLNPNNTEDNFQAWQASRFTIATNSIRYKKHYEITQVVQS